MSREAKSLPYLNNIYSEPIEETQQLYSLSADIIGSDNYVTMNDRHRQMIMHTVVDGDNGDIRVIKPAMNNVWASNLSLPNTRRSSPHLKTNQNDPVIDHLSPIQISFSENGQHFVNLNLHNDTLS